MQIGESFGWSGFARLVVGFGLIVWGYKQLDTVIGFVLAVVGLLPLATGTFDLCLISALLGGPISGKRIRGPRP